MSKILVTGRAGFIGSHICELLLSKDFEVTGIDNFDPFYDKAIKTKNLGAFIKDKNFAFYECDITKELDYCMNNSDLYLTLNLGNNNPVKLNDLVDIIYTEIGKQKNVSYTTMQPGDVDITFADIEQAEKILGYAPSININTGIRNFITWMKAFK
jgi:nucleoside-diphosphate-sugar epimerase